MFPLHSDTRLVRRTHINTTVQIEVHVISRSFVEYSVTKPIPGLTPRITKINFRHAQGFSATSINGYCKLERHNPKRSVMRDVASMYTFSRTSKKERTFILIKPKLLRMFSNNTKITGYKFLILKSKITYNRKENIAAHTPMLPCTQNPPCSS
jgi:hypothetical protein